jgi:hypothetical protein
MIDDLLDDPEYDEGPERDTSKACSVCHSPTAFEYCGFCGNDLCPACYETGGGFCSGRHTQEQIDEYELSIHPPELHEEIKRQHKARNELRLLGILPPFTP